MAYEVSGEVLKALAADLDLDGISEVLTVDGGMPSIVHLATSQRDACPAVVEDPDSIGFTATFAVGDLDGDPEGSSS